MTQLPDDLIDRRSYLRRLGITAAAVGGLSAPVAARGGDTLEGTPGYFSVYGNIPNTPDEFGFPDSPFLHGPNPIPTEDGSVPLFDSSEIRISPNRDTLHHGLQVFAGLLMKDDSKPYTLVSMDEEGLFEARGQTVNFTAPSDIKLPKNFPIERSNLSPILFLEGQKWRAVATERIKVDLSGEPPFDYEWAATRVDIYSRGGKKPEHTLSLIYLLWAGEEDSQQKENAEDHAETLIESGPLNMGRQSPKPR